MTMYVVGKKYKVRQIERKKSTNDKSITGEYKPANGKTITGK